MSRKRGSNAEIKVGDIYYSSWGYDQTNVNFYEVVAKKGKTMLVVREVKQKSVRATGPMAEEVTALPGEFYGEPFNASLNEYGSFKVDGRDFLSASPWDGQPRYSSSYA